VGFGDASADGEGDGRSFAVGDLFDAVFDGFDPCAVFESFDDSEPFDFEPFDFEAFEFEPFDFEPFDDSELFFAVGVADAIGSSDEPEPPWLVVEPQAAVPSVKTPAANAASATVRRVTPTRMTRRQRRGRTPL
jgi:hypothetical protein